MASESQSRFAGAVRELFSFDIYKRNQGRRVRQLTAAGIGFITLWGLYALYTHWLEPTQDTSVAYAVPVVLGVVAAWIIFRTYNWPRFADFLIATEAEMTKVSWSSKDELVRATIVVLVVLFLFAAFLYCIDYLASWILERIGVLRVPDAAEQVMLRRSEWDAAGQYVTQSCVVAEATPGEIRGV